MSLLRHKNSIPFFRSMTIYLNAGEIECSHRKKQTNKQKKPLKKFLGSLEVNCIRYELDALIIDLHETRALQNKKFYESKNMSISESC